MMKKNISDKPLVSVVMCCYNSERYVKETIDSVLGQTYDNFEFIIWNDGSTDATEDIVKSYVDNRIRYFYHENTGLGRALNLACRKVNGKYIARIDADDVCMLNRIWEEVFYLESHPSCIMVSSSAYLMDADSHVFDWNPSYTWNILIKKILREGGNIIYHPSVLFRRDIYEKTSGYTPIIGFEDILLWLQFLKYGKISILAKPLIKYRVLQNSISHSIATSLYICPITSLIRKMQYDKTYLNEDLALLEKLYQLAKHDPNNKSVIKKKSLFRTYSVIRAIFGEGFSIWLLSLIKNLFGIIRY